MFNARHVVDNNKWNIFSYIIFYIKMVQDCSIYINTVNKLAQKLFKRNLQVAWLYCIKYVM